MKSWVQTGLCIIAIAIAAFKLGTNQCSESNMVTNKYPFGAHYGVDFTRVVTPGGTFIGTAIIPPSDPNTPGDYLYGKGSYSNSEETMQRVRHWYEQSYSGHGAVVLGFHYVRLTESWAIRLDVRLPSGYILTDVPEESVYRCSGQHSGTPG